MNIVKEALQKQLNELQKEVAQIEQKHDELLSNSTHELVDRLDESFKEFKIDVTTTDITFRLDSGWDKFRVTRRENYSSKEKEYKYAPAELSMSSMSTDKDSDLKILICIGKLAEQKLNSTAIWNDLRVMMDSRSLMYKEDISEKRNMCWKLEAEIKRIENEEREDNFKRIFDKGTFKLENETVFYYGAGKWDRVFSKEFIWQKNEGKKTYSVWYMREIRTNPGYDEQGNSLEPVYENTKHLASERVRVADLESFVRNVTNSKDLITE